MKSKYEDLPDELHNEHIAPNFQNNSSELSSLALTSKRFYHLFQPKRLVDTLLSYVACGNQNAAKMMLEKHPELMLEKGSFIDPSGRYFIKISAFELVLWTMDVRYMGGMMLDCIPMDKKGDNLRVQLLDQYNKVKETGVIYTLDNQQVTESHFNFKPLIDALDAYVKNYKSWSDAKRRTHWCTVVGKEQAMLPMHVRHHYCDPEESFKVTPIFTKKELNRNITFYNFVTNQRVPWGASLQGLGVDFGISRGCWRVAAGSACGQPGVGAGVFRVGANDLAAISHLCKVRTKDLELISDRLVGPILQSEIIKKSCCTVS